MGASTGPSIFSFIDFEIIFFNFVASTFNIFSLDEDKIKEINLS